jgi:hypothetical protein
MRYWLYTVGACLLSTYGSSIYLVPMVATLAFPVAYQLLAKNSLVRFGLDFCIDK